NPHQQAQALVSLAGVLARVGQLGRAKQVAQKAETLIRTFTDPGHQDEALSSLGIFLAEAGHFDQAETLIGTITNPHQQAQALVSLAGVLARVGQLGRAKQVAQKAETLIRTFTDPGHQDEALSSLGIFLAEAGLFDQTEALIRTITNPHHQAKTLHNLISLLTETGHFDRAEALTHTITNPHYLTAAIAAIVANMSAQHSHRLLAWALTKTRSNALLAEIARIDPSAILRIAEVVGFFRPIIASRRVA
ncbi:hypothetical protein, partial [Nonomuraea sp. NPDC049504]|uniref:tetratricopeptide repeat protein n=1 Tax=Nonomuraea sp. NPDC049504 TaxID=3154729 RepID=UPI003434BD62